MTMMTTKTLMTRAVQAFATLGAAFVTQAALAVGDLAGGPAKNQLDLHPAITKIATNPQDPSGDMLATISARRHLCW